MKDALKDRFNIFGIILLLLAVAIILQLVNLQVIHGVEYDAKAQLILSERKILAPRGNIEDRNGIPIATSRMGFLVQIAYSEQLQREDLNSMLLKLIKIFDKNKDAYNKSFKMFLAFNPIGYGPWVSDAKSPINSLKTGLGIDIFSDSKSLKTPMEVFKYLREIRYKIDPKYSDSDAYKIMCMRFEIRTYTSQNSVAVGKDVSKQTVAEIEERHREYPGVTTDYEPIRKYISADIVSQVIGYIRGISAQEYSALKNKGYGMNDLIGKTGIEYQAEGYLKGTDGQRRVEVDTEGRLTEELGSKAAIPGDNIVLTLDMKLQKVAAESLKRNIKRIHDRVGETAVSGNFGDAAAGSVVALDIKTGEVLTMASFPNYDPNVFLQGSDNKAAQKLIDYMVRLDKARPMENRTIIDGYAPGSTFKPLMGVAGLQTGVITPTSTIYDPGVIYVNGKMLKCLEYSLVSHTGNHGSIDLKSALATSCNIYFQKLGMEKLGINMIDKYAKMFGLGEKTGIDLPGEAKGSRSNPEALKNSYYGKNEVWGAVHTAFSSIGQELSLFTPLQLANYISAIANGGKLNKPYIIKRAIKYDGTIDYQGKTSYRKLPVSKANLTAVMNGMEAVANSSEGTAASVFAGFPYKVAGKTGTAETPDPKKSNNGVFVCYAPADNPQIAIAVIIEQGVWGKLAAPVAKDILTEYFNLNAKKVNDDKIDPNTVVLTQ